MFGPGSVEVCVNVTITNDPDLELVEFFQIELTTQDSAVGLDPKEANITIISDDSKSASCSTSSTFYCTEVLCYSYIPVTDVTINLEQSEYTIEESGGNLNVCAILSGDSQVIVVTPFTILDGNAQGLFPFCWPNCRQL